MDAIYKILESNFLIGMFFLIGVVPLYIKLGIIKTNKEKNDVKEEEKVDIKQDRINIEMAKHAEVANEEMGEVKTTLAVIENRLGRMEEDIRDIKNKI